MINFIIDKLEPTKPISTAGNILDTDYRVKGDLAVTRLRIKDFVSKLDSDILSFMNAHLCHLDQTLLANLAIWAQLWGVQHLRSLHSLGMLNSVDIFATKMSKVSSFAKRFPFETDNAKQRWCEVNTLTGYMQNDIGAFDYDKEFESLATGGGERTTWWKQKFDQKLRDLMTVQERPDFIDFETYVKDGIWLTSGASNVGKVEWSYDGDSGKFKARKNMLFDLYTADELYDIALGWDGSLQNRVFIKDELSKRRLAVASNLEAYLNQAYLLYLFGHGFKNYKYITLDEKPNETHKRNCRLIKLLKSGYYALPFDFKGFDRQPETVENQAITRRIIELVRPTVPASHISQFDLIAAKNISCYDNNYLYSPLTKVTKRQTGGLPSGIRPTSLIGNIWNMIATDIARDYTTALLGGDYVKEIALKGDDTYIIAESFFVCLVFRYAYMAINAVGENSKFGIMQNACEFLRTEISTTGVRGWTNRAIPSVTQRKPWNPEPWTENQQVVTIANNIYLLERRSKLDCKWLHHANKMKWSKMLHQSYLWLHLPKHHGGFGIYEWDGWLPDCKLPLTQPPVFTVANLNPSSVSLSWLNLNEHQKRAYQEIEFSSKIAADDIPGPQKHVMRKYISDIRRIKPNWTKSNVPVFTVRTITGPTYENPFWPHPKIHTSVRSDSIGYPPLAEFVRQHQIAKRAKLEIDPLKTYIQKHYPTAYKVMVQCELKGWHRTDAINLACGKIPLEPVKILNPILSAWAQQIVLDSGLLRWSGRKNIANRLYCATKLAVDHLQLQGGASMYAF